MGLLSENVELVKGMRHKKCLIIAALVYLPVNSKFSYIFPDSEYPAPTVGPQANELIMAVDPYLSITVLEKSHGVNAVLE